MKHLSFKKYLLLYGSETDKGKFFCRLCNKWIDKQRLEMYQHAIDKLENHGLTSYGLCKDTLAIWRALKLNPEKAKCNCVW